MILIYLILHSFRFDLLLLSFLLVYEQFVYLIASLHRAVQSSSPGETKTWFTHSITRDLRMSVMPQYRPELPWTLQILCFQQASQMPCLSAKLYLEKLVQYVNIAVCASSIS